MCWSQPVQARRKGKEEREKGKGNKNLETLREE
jgi:hypothetical protein